MSALLAGRAPCFTRVMTRRKLSPTLYDASGHPVRLAPVPEAQLPGGAPDAVRAYRRQSVTVHVVLALTTAGLGNWIYAKWIGLSNRYRR